MVTGYPPLLDPPTLPDDLSQATFKERKRYVVYQMRTLRRLSANPCLGSDDREAARARTTYIRELLKAHPLLDDLSRCIEDTGQETLRPLLRVLSERARARIEEDPNVSTREVLAIFAGRLTVFDRVLARGWTAQDAVGHCTAYRCLQTDTIGE